MFLNGSGWEALQGLYKPTAERQERVGGSWTTHSPWHVAGCETPTVLLHPPAPLGSHTPQEECNLWMLLSPGDAEMKV